MIIAAGVRRIDTVRHAATGHNALGIISGRLDEPLSDDGRDTIRTVVEEVGSLRADVVVASPMRRTVETAQLLTGLSADAIETDPLCLERDYGRLQGLDREGVKQYADRVEYVEVGGIRHSLNPPDGESFDEVRRRAELFLDRLLAIPVESVLVVSHQVFLQQLHGLLHGLGPIDSLAIDIAPLEIDRFVLDEDGGRQHSLIHEGVRRYQSW
jgi:broad specificity phosphatase PhoE